MYYSKPFSALTTALAAAVSLAVVFSPAALAKHHSKACQSSAKFMKESCDDEREEDYNATLARCGSISAAAARTACVTTARTEQKVSKAVCKEQLDARKDVCTALGEDRYDDPLVDESITFIDPNAIGEQPGIDENPYVILKAGHTHVLRSQEYDPETDETSVEIIVVHATDEVREIQGVACRVLVDVVVEPQWNEEDAKWEFIPIEVTDDWFAQDSNENVYYCGEIARNFEDGILRDLDGSFEAGRDLAEGGALTLAVPAAGMMHRQEYALGEAEDLVEYLSIDADPAEEGIPEDQLLAKFQCSADGNACLMTYDTTPQAPDIAEFKYYLAGTGFVLSAALVDGNINTNSSEWLVCSEDSLEAVFADGSDCGFDHFGEPEVDVREELRQELCDQHEEYCDDGEE